MKKTLKIFLWVILAVVILLIIGAFALVKFVDPNDFKPQIISAVDSATGRQLSLPGKLSWTFYPEVGIHIGAASLSNPAGFSQNTFAQIDSANLAVSFWGLMQGKIQFNDLNLNGLRVFLIQERNQNNWTFPSNSSTSGSPSGANGKGSSTDNLSIAAIQINNGGISFDNYQTKSHYALSNINLNANNVGFGHAFPISLSTDYNVNQNMTGNFKVDSQVNFNQDKQILILKNLAVQSLVNYPTATGALKLTTNVSGNLTADLAAQTVTAPSLDFAINQIMKGEIKNLQINNFSAPKFSGSLSTSQFSLKDLLSSFGIKSMTTANKNILNQVDMATQFNGTMNSLVLNNLIFNMADSHLNGNVNVGSFSPLRLSENLKLNQLDLADFVNIKGARLPMQNIASSGALSTSGYADAAYPRTLNGDINLNIANLTLKGFDLSALIDSLGNVINSLKNLPQLSAASSQLQDQMQQVMNSQGINPNNGKSTNLGSLTGKINIRQGVVTTPTMLLQGPIIIANGSGSIDLTSQKINYELDAHVTKSNNSLLQNLVIPYQIQGSFGNISQGLNWISLQAQILKVIVIQIQQAVQNTVKSAVQSSLQQLQKGGEAGASGAADVGNAAAKAINSIFGGQGN
jgi:uncharacterized protein involved in outer membrane biogenesis